MKRIELDFYPAGSKRNTLLGWVLLLAAVLLGMAMLRHHNQLKGEQQRIEMMLRQQRDQVQPAPVNVKEITPQLQRATAVIDQLSFPWGNLFKALESSVTEDIALLTIQPNVAGHVITLSGEARNWNAMLEYIRRLGDNKFFSEVNLVSHHLQQTDPQHPVSFTLTCTWGDAQPQSPPEIHKK